MTDAIAEFRTSQPYYDVVGDQYAGGFDHFREQALLLFPNCGLDFYLVKISTFAPLTTPRGSNVVPDNMIFMDEPKADGPIEDDRPYETDKQVANDNPVY